MVDPLERLKVLINSSTPIVVIETVEEMRAVMLVRAAGGELNLPVFEWSIADGLTRAGGVPVNSAPLSSRVEPKPRLASGGSESERLMAYVMSTPGYSEPSSIVNTKDPAQVLAHLETMTIEGVFILKDFHRHIEEPVVVRRMRDVAQRFSTQRQTIVITAPSISLPPELSSLVEYLELPLPDVSRLRALVEVVYARLSKTRTLKSRLDAAGIQAVAENLRGLTEEEAERAVSQAIVTHYALCPEIITDILEAKKKLLRRSGMLEFIESSDSMANIGGLDNLKHWLQQRRGAWEESARSFGLEAPRGVIILGVQGCGKSMCARAVAGEWKLPLVRFDTSAVFDKFVGETEKRIKKLFQVAEELAPAVLWIDELEKVFAGSGTDSASSDAGVSSRLLGSFLSWMQERRAAVFVTATSNDVTALPPELIRKGRFDELFFVDLPNSTERKAVLNLQLARHKLDPARFDLDQLVAAAKSYSGAEIDAAVQTAMYAAFSSKKPVTTEMVMEALKSTIPLSATRAEEIQALRAWARQRAVPASLPDAQAEKA
ncbi:MAG TPA: AAA family ATPase [Candidatus Solibacter sp.]|nr:AAA family ATPase [Candidatus Solibacter sp.]